MTNLHARPGSLSAASRVACALAGVLISGAAGSHNPITTTVRFNREVAPILNAKCVPCHANGGMAMPLATYEQARPWAEAIKEEVLAHRMPPWPAERGFRAFANDAGLTPRERDFLISWIDGGAPEGDGMAPEAVDHSAHWMEGTPDAVYSARPRSEVGAPARMTRYLIDIGSAHGHVVRGFDLKIAHHHARAAFVSNAATGQYLGGWTPGAGATLFPKESGVRIDGDTRLAVDLLAPSGEKDRDAQLRLGVYFDDNARTSISGIVLRGASGDERGYVRATKQLQATQTVIGFRVDVANDAKSIELRARTPQGVVQPLLIVREYHADWPTPFVLKAPLTLPAGSELEAVARFDGERALTVYFVVTDSTATPGPQGSGPPAPHVHQHETH